MALTLIVVHLLYYVTMSTAAQSLCTGVMPSELTKFKECCPLVTKAEQDDTDEKLLNCLDSLTDECKIIKCIMLQYDVGLNETGMVDREKYKKHMQARKSGKVYALYTESIDECFKEERIDVCKLLDTLQCVTKGAAKKCPKSSIWNPLKMRDCDIIKEYMDKCSI